MGTFLFSTKKVKEEKVKEAFETRGHQSVEIIKAGSNTIIRAGKILVDNNSYISGAKLGGTDSDYIIGVGTFFYNGKFADDALRDIWDNWDAILKDNPIYGHWAFLVHKNGKTHILNDMSGSLRLFYKQDGDDILITTSMVGAIAAIDQPRFDKVRLSAYLAANFGGDIPFVEGLENFNSLKYLEIEDGKAPVWVDRIIPDTKRIDKLDEAVEYVKALFKQQTDQIKAIGKEKISIELTGGLDSRLTSSNLRQAGLNFDFLNYPLFGPDKEVAEIVSKGLGKKLLMQTNIPLSDGEIESHYGEFDNAYYYFRQYANPRWNIVNRLQFSGALGECINTPLCIDMLDDTRVEILLPKLVDTEMMSNDCKGAYKKYLIDYYQKRGFDTSSPMSQKRQTEFEQIMLGQLCGDYMYNSGCQAHIYFYNMFVEWHFNHFISDIAFDVKNGRKLTIALIKSIDPELASYPFVSRRRTKRKSVNSVKELPLHYFSYNGLKKMMPKAVVDFVYQRMGRSFDKTRFDVIDFDNYKDIVDVEELKRHRNLYSYTLNRMYSIEILRRILNISFD